MGTNTKKTKIKAPVKTIGPNHTLESMVLIAATELGKVVTTPRNCKSPVLIPAYLRNGIIDDETLGLSWSREFIKEILDKVDSLRDLSKYIHVGAIAPEEDTIGWVISRVEKLCEQQMECNDQRIKTHDFMTLLGNYFGGEITGGDNMFVHAAFVIEKGLKDFEQRLKDKDIVSKELSDQINILAEFIMSKHPEAIVDEGACLTAVSLITKMQTELNFKAAALDDAMNKVKEGDELKKVIEEQIKPRLELLNPNHTNFDQILGIVMQYTLNNRATLSERHVQMLKAITCLV
jgi:hypothetical protein